ncbi:FAD-binding oxidoreductase [Nocardia sp. NRRL S-836]|uniref:FAD-binding oxidoreductase n=1 Tax=Nocardia sp. NRRL S-836 TaxID=1519492 RepID=UPI0018D1833E|nr:FAD-binding oxidoreductase [Nocardia sp. NRRL S-836]
MIDVTRLTGAVLQPGTPEYERARLPAMANFHHIRPLAVVRCSGVDDVVNALAYARESGMHVVPRSGGHCFAGRSSTDGIVLDLTPMNDVSMHDGLVTVGGGARLAEVYTGLDRHGLTLPAGCGATVGIAGLTLGGGLGLLGRRYGLTADRLRAAEVVLPDGEVVECSAGREPDLFWALRGAGGGQFGVVTRLVFEPVPAELTTRFALTWPLGRAGDVLRAWQEIAPDAPDELSANLKIGASGVVLFGAGQPDAFLDLAPRTGDISSMPYYELKQSFDDLGDLGAGPVLSRSEFFGRPLPDAVLPALLSDLGPGRELNFTPMGGAYARTPVPATAFAHRGERFMIEHVGTDTAWVHASWERAHDHASGRVYPNFPDPHLTDPLTAYHGENLARLRSVKQRYDPGGLLRFPQSL